MKSVQQRESMWICPGKHSSLPLPIHTLGGQRIFNFIFTVASFRHATKSLMHKDYIGLTCANIILKALWSQKEKKPPHHEIEHSSYLLRQHPKTWFPIPSNACWVTVKRLLVC